MDDRNHTDRMTLQRFARIVEAYGASPRRWPQSERESAERLMQDSDEAKALVAQSAALDALLEEVPQVEPSASLRDRIVAAAPAPARRTWTEVLNEWASSLWPVGRSWQPIGALAAAAALGIAAGLVVSNGSEMETDSYEMSDIGLDDVADPGDLP